MGMILDFESAQIYSISKKKVGMGETNEASWVFWDQLTLELFPATLNEYFINSLSDIPTKWSNKFKQFVGCFRGIVRVYLTILWGWGL